MRIPAMKPTAATKNAPRRPHRSLTKCEKSDPKIAQRLSRPTKNSSCTSVKPKSACILGDAPVVTPFETKKKHTHTQQKAKKRKIKPLALNKRIKNVCSNGPPPKKKQKQSYHIISHITGIQSRACCI
jgi:hypothetical protein